MSPKHRVLHDEVSHNLRSPTTMKLPSPSPSPIGMGEGIGFKSSTQFLSYPRPLAGEGRVRVLCPPSELFSWCFPSTNSTTSAVSFPSVRELSNPRLEDEGVLICRLEVDFGFRHSGACRNPGAG